MAVLQSVIEEDRIDTVHKSDDMEEQLREIIDRLEAANIRSIMYVCVCMYVCMYVCIWMDGWTDGCNVWVYVYVYLYVSICVYVLCMCFRAYVCIMQYVIYAASI